MELSPTGYVDHFARESLPPQDQWPTFEFTLPELQYPDRLNAAAELIDAGVTRFGPDKVALRHDRRYVVDGDQAHPARSLGATNVLRMRAEVVHGDARRDGGEPGHERRLALAARRLQEGPQATEAALAQLGHDPQHDLAPVVGALAEWTGELPTAAHGPDAGLHPLPQRVPRARVPLEHPGRQLGQVVAAHFMD